MGGRSLANRGIDNTGSLFNCYSRGYVEDDYNDIMDVCKDIGVTFKAQGGQGISLSKLRPKGTPIKDEYVSDGIIPFMKIFNEVTAGTSQGGARKGALMISLDARHKEVSDFIRIKSKEGEIEKANLSLEVDDEFMEAVQKYYDTGEIVTLHEKRNYSGHEIEYDIVPIEIFKLLVDNCYDWADPACLFVNRFRNYNLMELVPSYEIETSNPCGEQPLPKNGACCLSSLNLSQFIDNPYTEKASFNEHAFINAIGVGIRTLDKLIDENYYRHPLKAQREMSFNYRNIGLGIFGYASALMKLGLRYGSPEALDWTNFVFDTLFVYSVLASNELAKKYGPFPKYDSRIFDSEIIKRHFTLEEIEQCLLFYNGQKALKEDFWLTDDLPEMIDLNESPCWLWTRSEFNNAGDRIAYKLSYLPEFISYYIDNGNITKSFDFGIPREIYIDNVVYPETSTLYNQFWDKFYKDQFNVNTKKVTCYILADNLNQESLRYFYWFNNAYWLLNKIDSLDIANKNNTVRCEFIKVQNINNYAAGNS